MNQTQLVIKSLFHYWKTNLALVFGVIAGTAVITGAMIVGDSVKASLRQMTLDRLGKIDEALTGPRFFCEQLTETLSKTSQGDETQQKLHWETVAPAIMMQAGLQAKSGTKFRRAGKVSVYGLDASGWSLIDQKGIEPPTGLNVVLNARGASAIDAKVGDEVTLWIELPTAVPRDTLLGNKDNDSQEITVTVSAIAPDDTGLGRLGLLPTQSLPINAFIDLHVLQERLGLDEVKRSQRDPLGKPARINSILVNSNTAETVPQVAQSRAAESLLQKSLSLADLNLRLVDSKHFPGFVIESEQMILEDALADAAKQAAADLHLAASPLMVYLANKIWNPKLHDKTGDAGYSMYSTVAGLDLLGLQKSPFAGFEFVGDAPDSWGDNDVVLNEFLAQDLSASVGDEIKFKYHLLGSRGELPELEQTVTVRGIVKMTGAAVDRSMIPEVKGITDVESLADWDQPFPMDIESVTRRDDEYWSRYRAIPKLYMPLKTAQKLWPSRYGSLTSIRIASIDQRSHHDDGSAIPTLKDEFTARLLQRINPSKEGLMFQPVKAMGLQAANGSTDFSGLFFGFSMFLIVAAMILIGLLFRLGIEQRVRDLGLLGAVGFTSFQVRFQMLLEGIVTSLAGGLAGTIVAVAYAYLMIYGLTHWWVGAVGTRNLLMTVVPQTLVVGFVIAVLAAIASIWWALRNLKQFSFREQLAGVVQKESDFESQQKQARRNIRRAQICVVLAAVLLGGSMAQALPAAAAFFGSGVLLLAGSLQFLSAWLQTETGTAVRGRGIIALARLGLRNASRQRQRTVMSAGMIAVASFMIVAVAAFRRDPTGDLPDKKSGNGGFTLVAESSSPILYDMNTSEGRKKLQLTPPENSTEAKTLAEMRVAPFRVKPGEDASCLNLYQTRVPTILGVPQSLIDEGRFAFASGSWAELSSSAQPSTESKPTSDSLQKRPIPVLGDMNTLMFSLHKQVGQTISVPSDVDPQFQLVVKGMFQDSIFQGVLVMSEDDFLKCFPEQKGFQYFLIEVPPAEGHELSTVLESELAEYGLDVEPVAERLARFLSVQNTYLSTFQTLGGLGLLLGTFGLATVMLRNVLDRQAEIALLRAVGFRERGVALLVLCETAFLLIWGLIAGAGSALLATLPNLVSRGTELPWESLATLMTLVFAAGMLAALFAVRASVRLPIVLTLRGE